MVKLIEQANFFSKLVTHLRYEVLPDENVAGGEVAVNELLSLQVGHAVRALERKIH